MNVDVYSDIERFLYLLEDIKERIKRNDNEILS